MEGNDSRLWRSGNLEMDGIQYIYEILLNRFPIRDGIFGGRILELYLYDEKDQTIACYKRSWILAPDHGTIAYKLVGKILKEHNFRKKGRTAA